MYEELGTSNLSFRWIPQCCWIFFHECLPVLAEFWKMEKSRRNVIRFANVQPVCLLLWQSTQDRKLQHRTNDQESIGFWTFASDQKSDFNIQENFVNHFFFTYLETICKVAIQARRVQESKRNSDGVQWSSERCTFGVHDLWDIPERRKVIKSLGILGRIHPKSERARRGIYTGFFEPRVDNIFVHMFGQAWTGRICAAENNCYRGQKNLD